MFVPKITIELIIAYFYPSALAQSIGEGIHPAALLVTSKLLSRIFNLLPALPKMTTKMA